jgi:hypothetical protein
MALCAAGDDGTVLYFGVAACQADWIADPWIQVLKAERGCCTKKVCRVASSTSDGEGDGSTFNNNLGCLVVCCFWRAADLGALPMRCRGFGLRR